MSRIVVATWGSLGDLHPMMAVALGLRDRGHEIVFATADAIEQQFSYTPPTTC